MAKIPTPKSNSQILGQMVNTFLSKLGLPSIKTGDPSLSIMEAAAQSDFRASNEVLKSLSVRTLNGQDGAALDATGYDEQLPRIPESASNGYVTISDSAFAKKETRVFQGGTGIVAGSTTITVEDASTFPAAGSIYIGRGTPNSEGPLAYAAAPTSFGNYWTITVTSAVQNYHQLGETVVLAQGGDRAIPAGTMVSTPTTSAGGQVQFRTLFAATIPDGETSVNKVSIECQSKGLAGRVSANQITSFVSLPFPTATVSNPLPLTNGTATEDSDSYRERIRLARKSRVKAIRSAIVSNLVGARALDESSKITSVSTSFRADEPRTIHIDDGTGYEDKDEGVVQETLIGSAQGGEQFFGLQSRPIAKAYAQSNDGPFVAVGESVLSVRVGGVLETHTFSSSQFRNLNSATAYEVAASINSDAGLSYSARTTGVGTGVAIFAKQEFQEDIEVAEGGANDWLKFDSARKFTLYLYRNDVLLTEDGVLASLQSRAQGLWTAITSGATMNLTVDGIAQNITVTDNDFVLANTGYISVSQYNSLASWAAVLNNKIAGVNTTVVDGYLVMTSNLGRNSRASVNISSGTLSAAMFDNLPLTSTGKTNDYVLDRNSAQIKLSTPLVAGDKLVAGSTQTQAFLESNIGSLTIGSGATSVVSESGAELWFAIDGDASFIVTNIGTGTSLTWTLSSTYGYGDRISVSHATLPVWQNVVEGDYLVVTDSAVTQGARGSFRVAEKISNSEVHIERVTGSPVGTFSLTEGGVKVVRSSTPMQRVYIPSLANYTPTSLAAVFNSSLSGATAAPYATNKLRLATNSKSGSIAVVAANAVGSTIFPVGVLKVSQISHLAGVLSGNSETGIPVSGSQSLSAVASDTAFTTSGTANDTVVLASFLRPYSDGANLDRRSNQAEQRSIVTAVGSAVTVRPGATKEWLAGNRLFYSRGFDLTARDTISVLADNDNVSGRYTVNMYRPTKVITFAGTMELAEIGGASLAAAFGTDFDWRDFAVAMKARTKTHSSPDTNKTILWRWWRHGLDGVGARLQYQYPAKPSTTVAVQSNNVSDVIVRLESGPLRPVASFNAASKIGMAITSFGSGLYTYQYVANLPISAAARTIRINYTGSTGVFVGGETVSTGTGSATVVSNTITGASSGFLIVSGVVPTISSNQTLTGGTSGATAQTASGPFGYTTLTLTLPSGVTNHGLSVGTTIFMTPGDANFLPGARTITEVSSISISYFDTVATTASAGAIGSVSNSLSNEVTINGTTVVTGDIFSGANTSFASAFKNPIKITVGGTGRSWTGVSSSGQTPSTTLVWAQSTGATFYPLVANTAAQIAAAVNNLQNIPVSAVAVGTAGLGTATGIISDATYETAELGGSNPWWYLTDGSNWVRSTNTPANTGVNFIYTLRNTTTTSLTSNADIANEDVRLVPVTAKSIADFLGSTGASGLGARGTVADSNTGKIQIKSDSAGSAGAIQVLGGSANVSGVALRGSPTLVGVNTTVVTDLSNGLGAGQWVWMQNATTNTKNAFTTSTALTSITAAGEVTLDNAGPKAWTVLSIATNASVQIERRGAIVALNIAVGNVNDYIGHWIRVQAATANPVGAEVVADQNLGIFRIVNATSDAVWIENANAVEQIAGLNYSVLHYDSILPGDFVSFGATTWGDNVGRRAVTALGSTEWKFTLDNTQVAINPVGAVGPLNSAYPQFKVEAAIPNRMLATVGNIGKNSTDSMKVVLLNQSEFAHIGELFGTSLITSNKLGFATAPAVGLDSYRRNTGLIAEANRIVFGDETNVVDYEGVASGGASYNIAGPLVRRVKIAVSIRSFTGVNEKDLRQQIASSIAATVNASNVGQSIALSSIVAAARVSGVEAVTITSPIYGVGDDLIVIHPYEKALVTDPENDISISFLGA